MKRIADPAYKAQYLAAFRLQDELSEPVIKMFDLYSVSKGEYVCHQGALLSYLYLLLDGKLQVDAFHPDGNLSVFSFEMPLSVIGDLELFDDQPAHCNVQALENCLVLAAPANSIRSYGYNEPTFLRFLISSLGKKVYFSTHLLANTLLPLEYRLARYLQFRMAKEGSGFTLEKRDALAAMLGTSTRHLNRTLSELKQCGAIELRNKTLTIQDAAMLTSISSMVEKGT